MNNRGWLVLIRAAELVARLGTVVRVDRLVAPRDPGIGRYDFNGWRFTIITDDQLDLNAPYDSDESMQLCELTANRWMERMRDAPTACTATTACAVCGVKPAEWCRPVHDGERMAGGWLHPQREELVESAVVAWARRVKLGNDKNEILPGIAMRGQGGQDQALMVEGRMKVVDEILALAYINDLMRVAGGAKPVNGVGDDVVAGRLSFGAGTDP